MQEAKSSNRLALSIKASILMIISSIMGCHSEGAFTDYDIAIKSIQIKVINPPSGYVGVGAQIAASSQLQYQATATYSNGLQKDVTNEVAWESDESNIARINALGVAKGLIAGDTYIHAEIKDISSNELPLKVSNATLTEVTVNGTRFITLVGLPLSFNATASFNDGTTQDVTQFSEWESSNSDTATITQGNLTPLLDGTTDVSANYLSLNDSITVDVIDKSNITNKALAITPTTTSIPQGSAQQYIATLTLDTTSTPIAPIDVTNISTWSSDNAAVEMDTTTAGRAKGLELSTNVNITASININDDVINSTTTLDVIEATPSEIDVICDNTVIPLGRETHCSATAKFDNTEADIPVADKSVTDVATWSTGTGTPFTVDHNGVITTSATGTDQVIATWGAISGSESLTVSDAVITGIILSSAQDNVIESGTLQMVATAITTDTTTLNVTNNVIWEISSASVASIENATDAGTPTPGLLSGKEVDADKIITVSASGINSEGTLLVAKPKDITVNNEIIKMCGDGVNDTNKSNSVGSCLKVASDKSGKLFTSSPSEAVMIKLGYHAQNTETNSGDTYAALQNDTSIMGGKFALFRQDGTGSIPPVNGESNEHAGDNGQFYRWCEKLSQLNFAGKNNWHRPSVDELVKLYNDTGGSLWDKRGWPTLFSYFSTTVGGSAYNIVNFDDGDNSNYNWPSAVSYASCVSN